LCPNADESFGRLGAMACALLCRVANMAAGDGGIVKAAFIKNALQDMSVMLCKGKYACCAHTLSRVAQAGGRAHLRGLPAPVTEVVGMKGKSDVGRLCIVCCAC
jgi:hypothetical protein